MKLSAAITPRGGLRLVAVLVMCCAILAHISATEEALDGQRSEGELNFNGVSADGADPGKLKQSLMQRERRSANNATPTLSVIEKRLEAMEDRHNRSASLMDKRFQELEKRLDTLLRLPLKSSDSYSSLMAFILGQHLQNGAKERMGPPGPPGNTGPTGKTGLKGEPGKPGTNKPFPGPPGPKGDQGAVGKTGAQGPKGEKGQDGAGKSGVKYVRWGRTTCPSGAQVVYKGIMGGESHSHPGGGANYLCLPHNPKYDKYKDGHQYAGYIYGTEYEVSQYNGDPFQRTIHDHEAPCVVCFVKSRGSMLMMPARNDCPSGWTEEYHGYLMTEYYNHKHSSEFVCVDGDPEYVRGTFANKNGALLLPVEGVCGSLPCQPYVAGRELTCAVCTK